MAANRVGASSLIVASLVLLEACHSSSSDDGGTPPPPPPPPPPGVTSGSTRGRRISRASHRRRRRAAARRSQLQRVFPNLTFSQPLAMLQAPGDDSRWFVLEKRRGSRARVREHAERPTASNFISLTVNAQLRRRAARHGVPSAIGRRTARCFCRSREGTPMVSVVARYTISASGATLDPATRANIIRVESAVRQPQRRANRVRPRRIPVLRASATAVAVAIRRARRRTRPTCSGSISAPRRRTAAAPYAIPAGQSVCVGQADCAARTTRSQRNNCPEIYAWGLRNPWRWSFDSRDRRPLGRRRRPGRVRGDRSRRSAAATTAGIAAKARAPSAARRRAAARPRDSSIPCTSTAAASGFSVTGGYVYRGTALPALVGSYLFADYGSGRIWRLVPNGGGGSRREELLDTSLSIASFGQGNDGELYVVDIAGGGAAQDRRRRRRRAAGPARADAAVGDGLRRTRRIRAQPASGLIPYEPAAPFWSDNATKERWLAIPNGTSIGVGARRRLQLPERHGAHEALPLERRARRDAPVHAPPRRRLGRLHLRVERAAHRCDARPGRQDGGDRPQSWIFPSGNDCLTCHTAAAGFALGLEAAQLNHDFTYASTGRTANQLRTLDAITMFTTPLGDPALQPSMPDPFDTAAPLAQRARAYLHTNCAQCHRTGRTDAELDGPALLDVAVEHERLRRAAAVGRPRHRRGRAHHRARQRRRARCSSRA